MEDKHLNSSQFCNMIAISPGTLSHIRSGRTEPTLNILRQIQKAFPDINPLWLFSNDGSMYFSDSTAASENAEPEEELVEEKTQNDVPIDLFGFTAPNNQSSAKVAALPQSTYGSNSARGSQNQKPISTVGSTSPVVSVQEVVAETLKLQQKPQRKVVEVRIFFDDGTFETFER